MQAEALCSQDSSDNIEISGNISAVLDKYTSVFTIPDSLPPKRNVDHAIPLQKGSKPLKLKPYRYLLYPFLNMGPKQDPIYELGLD